MKMAPPDPDMKPNIKLAETKTPDGHRFSLHSHDGSFCIRLNGREVMHSSVTTSEILLGELAAGLLARRPGSRCLIGGLGLGFTLKSVLEKAGPKISVHVAELMPEVVEWNRTFLAGLNGALLNDPRVQILTGDVWDIISRAPLASYDAILLDIDNGPAGMVQKENSRIYKHKGILKMAAALKTGGRAAIWSSYADRPFHDRLVQAGFEVEIVPAKAYPNAKRFAYTIYVADKVD